MDCNGSELRCAVGTCRSVATTRLASTQVLDFEIVTCDRHAVPFRELGYREIAMTPALPGSDRSA